VSDLDKKIEEAANDHKEIGGNQIFIEGAHFVRDLLAEENKRLKEKLGIAVEVLGKIYQLETMELPDKNTLLKKHNIMASFANNAIAKIKEESE
jgi:hypothetical protein